MTAMGVLRVLVLVAVMRSTWADLDFIVNSTHEFHISRNGQEIMRQSYTSTIVSVGVGSATFNETHGMFEVGEAVSLVQDADVLLSYWARPGVVFMTLTSSNDPNLMVSLDITENLFGLDGHVSISASITNKGTIPYNRLWLRVVALEDEKVFGGGEQYTYLNLRGYDFPVWTSEQGIGRDGGLIANVSDVDGGAGGVYYTTYWPQASYVSSRRYSMQISNHNYLVMNFSANDHHEFYVHSLSLDAKMIWGETMVKVVEEMALSLGTPPPLPKWIISGAILGLQRGTSEVLQRYEEAVAGGVEVVGLWVQDWSGTTETLFGHRVYWNWKWNQTYYPGLDEVIQDLALEGVRVLTYINPHLIVGGDMFLEADALGFLLQDSEGNSFEQDFGGFMAGTVDLLRQEAREWYTGQIEENMLGLGLGGWMADFGEYTRLDMYTQSARTYTPEEVHNLLPVEWARCNRNALVGAHAEGEVVPFMRSGGLGSSGLQSLAWAGDQNVNWAKGDGLPSTVVAALNLGMSGMCVTHFDIGGYTTQPPVLQRSKELFLRSAEYAAFTPVMRTHEGNKPSANHQFYTDQDTLDQFARLTQIHARLSDYTMGLVQDCSNYGTPVQRPMFLEFENDPAAWSEQYRFQYMYGPDLIVAPVLTKNTASIEVYVPANATFVSLWWDMEVTGPFLAQLDAPMGYPAVLYRQGSLWTSLFEGIKAEFSARKGVN